jgi:hypothetical protein
MKSLEDLNQKDFEALVGKTFTLDGHTVTLKQVDTREAPGKKFRAPMSLTFTGPEDTGVIAGTHTLSHPDIGEHALLVHRVIDPDEPIYEIVLG